MQLDLFGREVFTSISGDTAPLFHTPVAVPRPPLPKGSASDAKIARKFDPDDTAPIPFVGKKREPMSRRVGRAIRASGRPFVSVDEAKRALFVNADLSAFHFVVYAKDDDANWLVFCGEPNKDNRKRMASWLKVFGKGFRVVFATDRRAGGLTFFGKRKRLEL